MRALIDEYGLETVWAVVLLLLFLNAPARAQPRDEGYKEPVIGDCPLDGDDCETQL